jgi:DNA-binding response OmpR family regulator
MSYRIAVVDDDTSILDLLRVILESEGYAVDTFSSAPVALKSGVKNPPDAAIVDLMMPGMDGLELLRALRYNSRTRALPVLICSAYYENLANSDADLAKENVLRLRKPFHVQELLNLVEKMVSGPRPDRVRRRGNRAAGGSSGSGRVSAFAA